MNRLEDYILTVEGVIPNHLCDAILAEYMLCDDWVDAVVSGGQQPDIRSCRTIATSMPIIIEKNKDVRQKLDEDLFKCASMAIKQYNSKFKNSSIEEDSGYELLEYSKGQFYKEHVDSFKGRPRSVSCSFALNDEYTGGEFAFFGGELQVQIPKGAALMFPSNFMYPHQILPVTSGMRYSIVTWFI